MKRIIGVVAGAILLSGCATIVGDETQLVQVNSNPSGASFKVKDESGVIVAQGKTPQGVTLAKSDGSYFGKKSYQITMEKDGYEPVTLPIKANA
ncbi:hypothetical protein LB995_005471, partial [Escherichia coli]|nr:hypothetical protein [Escherichia coli]